MMKFWKSFLIFCLVLTLALATVACSGNTQPTDATTEPYATIPLDGSTLGEGQYSFTFQVTLQDETSYTYTIATNEETVGAALQALNLIDGEESEYGLYVTTVLGVTLDYNADGYWWTLSENGTATSVGVDSLSITNGNIYAFTATAA